MMEETKFFRSNAIALIEKMLELNILREDGDKHLVDEILHSIFFLGRIITPQLLPDKIVDDSELLDNLKKQFPRPFDLCSSQIPRRSPFSCVLDMIVFLEGQEKEDTIIRKLKEIIRPLKKKNLLLSYTICVSQKNQNSDRRYYGVSMSRMRDDICLIMIFASCLGEYWDSYVAGAVMTYHLNIDSYFNGTIKLPEHVHCKTFRLFQEEEVYMHPCLKCQTMFGLKDAEGVSAESQIAACSVSSTSTPPPDTDTSKTFHYGNCAEAESLSNLFKNDSEVRRQARPTDETMSRDVAAMKVRVDLMEQLTRRHFTWDNNFYNPQL